MWSNPNRMSTRAKAARSVDAAGAIESFAPSGHSLQLAASLLVLGLSGLALWRLAGQNSLEANETSRTIVCLATLGSMYHATYDAVLLWPAIVSLACASPAYWRFAPRWFRPTLLACLMVPMLNILPAPFFIDVIDRLGINSSTIPAPWPEVGWASACHLSGLALVDRARPAYLAQLAARHDRQAKSIVAASRVAAYAAGASDA